MKHFKRYSKQDILSLTRIRRFETKIGERVMFLSQPEDLAASLKASDAKYVLFGIPEDLGVRGNEGTGGADTAWVPFLQSFLNAQSNDFFDGKQVLLAGHFDFGDIQYLIDTTARGNEERIEAYRHAVVTIDEEVETLVKLITEHQKIPLVVGGGHNNAYPLLKGAAKGWHKAGMIPLAQLNCINLDAHTDYRPTEGRHSGNAFRYAEEDGYLQKYCVIGVQESYLPQNVWVDIVNNPFIDLITFEDIFLHRKKSFTDAISHALDFTGDGMTGIELDLDIIRNTLSSAMSPVGIDPLHARQFISRTGTFSSPAYLHLCEGAVRMTDGKEDQATGKLLSHLVIDFVKGHSPSTGD